MNHTLRFSILIVAGLCSAISDPAAARMFYYDNFRDGDVLDGNPFNWAPSEFFGLPDFEVVNGDLVVSSTASIGLMIPQVSVFDFENLSIRSQVRMSASEGYRIQVATGDDETITRYAGGLSVPRLHRPTTAYTNLQISGDPIEAVDDISVPLIPHVEDVVLQLDVIGDAIEFWAWRAGDPMPSGPLGSFTDDQITLPKVGVEVLTAFGGPPVDTLVMEVRYFAFSDARIRGDIVPEPTAVSLVLAGIAIISGRRVRHT